MYSDYFLTQPHGSVRFVVFVLPTESNRNIRETQERHLLNFCHLI